MVSRDDPPADGTDLDAGDSGGDLGTAPDEPDIAFQAGFGFYLGLVVTAGVMIAGILATVTTGALFGLVPSTLLIVTLIGHFIARRTRGLPERIGGSLLRRGASYLPVAALFAIPGGLALLPDAPLGLEATPRLGAVAAASGLVVAGAAYGLNRLSRTRYVDSRTDDEPILSWDWVQVGRYSSDTISMVTGLFLLISGVALATDGGLFGLFLAGYGGFLALSSQYESASWADPGERWNPPTIAVYDDGLVLKNRTLLEWDAILDIRLTDEALVIEREGFARDIHCDRAAMADPEAVLETIKRTRDGARRSPAASNMAETERTVPDQDADTTTQSGADSTVDTDTTRERTSEHA
ncbi:PH domain-containing protein [Natronolimnobius sp. AArcel1]|uniref:PH domain-containing protein n=1 Tax=Natronolimnobius sp. AArcel1 TaxID=1679093 RepID=UPI0013EA33D4|nr:PH domain-containing protein [Natronolimnobius sp. AArcel1]NGM69858.1 PH domain-containing protein [Natronolimnobius sp. AArcel1]